MQFMYALPTTVYFGAGSLNNLGEILGSLKAKRIFLVCDKGVKSAGLVQKVIECLQAVGCEWEEYDAVLPNPPDYQVEEATALAKKFMVEAIVAVGGGSAIDAAKAINILLANPAPIAQYDGVNLVPNPSKPLIAIPTTAGTGSEVTAVSVITDTKIKKKMVIIGKNVSPTFAIVDPSLTYELPAKITASTGMDALTHAIEGYISTLASPCTDAMALESMRYIAKSLKKAVLDGSDTEARNDMLLGSLLAGMCFSMASLGLVHSLAHPMSAHCNVPHGVANAICLPYVFEFNAPSVSKEKIKRIADALGLATQGRKTQEQAFDIVSFLLQLSKDINIPRLKDVGVPKEMLKTIAFEAINKEIATLTNPRKADEGMAMMILEKAW